MILIILGARLHHPHHRRAADLVRGRRRQRGRDVAAARRRQRHDRPAHADGDQHLPAAGGDLLRVRRRPDGARRHRAAPRHDGRGAGRLAARRLAQIVCVASMFFGGVTGSAVAEVSSIGGMMIPAMEKDGYTKRFATAIVLTAATMGPIIPPSIGMIVFAHVAGNVSIAALFLAGVVPGVLIGAVADGRVIRSRQALSPEDAAEAAAPREDPPRHRRHGRRVHHGDHPRRHHLRRLHRDRGRRRGIGLRADPHGLRLQGDQDFRIAGDPVGMLPHQRRGDDADRDLLGVRLDSHLRESADHAGGQFLQPDPQQMGVPADPQRASCWSSACSST